MSDHEDMENQAPEQAPDVSEAPPPRRRSRALRGWLFVVHLVGALIAVAWCAAVWVEPRLLMREVDALLQAGDGPRAVALLQRVLEHPLPPPDATYKLALAHATGLVGPATETQREPGPTPAFTLGAALYHFRHAFETDAEWEVLADEDLSAMSGAAMENPASVEDLDRCLALLELMRELGLIPPDRGADLTLRAVKGTQRNVWALEPARFRRLEAVLDSAGHELLAEEATTALVAGEGVSATALPMALCWAETNDAWRTAWRQRTADTCRTALADGRILVGLRLCALLALLPDDEGRTPALPTHLLGLARNAGLADTHRQACVQRAFRMDPELADSEDARWIALRFSDLPTREWLDECISFLADFPESRHRTATAILFVERYVAEARETGGMPFSPTSVIHAAKGLLGGPTVPGGVGDAVLALGECLHEMAYSNLAVELLAGAERSPHLVSKRRDCWRVISRASDALEDEAAKLAIRTVHQLTVHARSAPGLHRVPTSNVIAVIPLEAHRGTWSPAQLQALTTWVRKGGVAWIGNDVLTAFPEVPAEPLPLYNDWAVAESTDDRHRVLAGCWLQEVRTVAGEYRIAEGPGTVTLWRDLDGRPIWSLVRIGRGWVSDTRRLPSDAEASSQAGEDSAGWGHGDRFRTQLRLLAAGDATAIPLDPCDRYVRPWVEPRTAVLRTVRQRVLQTVAEHGAELRPGPREAAERLGLPWPLPEASRRPEEVRTEAERRLDSALVKAFGKQADVHPRLLKESRETFPLHKVGDPVELVVRGGRGPRSQVRGLLQRATSQAVIVGLRRIPTADLDPKAKNCLFPDLNEKARAQHIERGLELDEGRRKQFREAHRERLLIEVLRESGYRLVPGSAAAILGLTEHRRHYLAPDDMHQRMMTALELQAEAKALDRGQAVRRQLTPAALTRAGFVVCDGDWVPTTIRDLRQRSVPPPIR